jgi:MarR family 2-MHQ and catechol resistance regulon transcriptional repressor
MWVKLARASSVFYRGTAEHIRTFGLTVAQFGVLEVLGHKGPLTFRELCHKGLVTGGDMTVVVDNLERDRLVERHRSTTDRRVIEVQLTPKGKRLFERIFPEHAKLVAELASVLGEGEQRRLGSLLKKLGTRVAEKSRQAQSS